MTFSKYSIVYGYVCIPFQKSQNEFLGERSMFTVSAGRFWNQSRNMAERAWVYVKSYDLTLTLTLRILALLTGTFFESLMFIAGRQHPYLGLATERSY